MPVRDLLSAASTQGAAPADPYFYDVSLLLNGDGTNGAQNNTFLDSSTNNFTITRNGNTTQGSFSPYGSLWSNYFDGSSNLVTTATQIIPSTGDFTVECWVYWTNSSYCTIFAQGTSGTSGRVDCYIDYTTNKIVLQISGPAISSTGTITLNSWNHIAITRTGSSVAFYINGATAGTGTLSSATQNTTFRIGNDWVSQPFYGYISNLRVSNSLRYTTTFTPSTTPFTSDANTVLLSCQSNRFIDNSSNAYALTISGSPQVQRFSPFNPTATYSTSVIGGSGYLATGGSDYLTVASNAAFCPGTSQFSVEFWYNKLAYGGNEGVLINTEVTGGLIITIAGGGVALSQRSTGNNLQSSANPIVGQWNHIVACRDSSNNTAIFLNGVRVASGTVTANYTTGALYVGDLPVSGYWATGYYSGLRIVKGSTPYDPTQTTITVPTAPPTAIANTGFLANFTNAGIPDLAMQNDLQTVGNAQVSTSVVKYGTGSVYINGVNNYLSMRGTPVNSLAGTGNFTVEMWVYPTATPPIYDAMLLSRGVTSGSGNYQFGLSGGSTGTTLAPFIADLNSPILTTSTAVSLNTWTHIAWVRSGTTWYIFVNGTQTGTTTSSRTFTNNSSDTVYLGASSYSPSDSNRCYTGYIDDARVTTGYARYTSNFTPPTSALPTY